MVFLYTLLEKVWQNQPFKKRLDQKSASVSETDMPKTIFFIELFKHIQTCKI